jgi:hypothetical protein
MKTTGKISIILLALILAGSSSLDAQRGMRGMGPGRMHFNPDSARMERQRQIRDSANFRGQMRMMEPVRGMRPRDFNRHDHFQDRYPNMRPGYGMMPGRPYGWNRILNNIQGLTENQKTEIGKLRKEQQAEMEKFRADFSEKMNKLREEHRNKVLEILSDEQKENLEPEISKPGAPLARAARGKTGNRSVR